MASNMHVLGYERTCSRKEKNEWIKNRWKETQMVFGKVCFLIKMESSPVWENI